MIKLSTGDLRLRALEPEDLSLLIAWENNPEYWTAAQQTAPHSEYLLKEYLKEAGADPFISQQLRLVVCHGDQSIGLVDCFDLDPHHRRAGVGILIGKEHQGKGHAQVALQLFVDYLFKAYNLQQVYVGIAANNPASLELFKKVGFREYGQRKDWYLREGEWITEVLFQLRKEDL